MIFPSNIQRQILSVLLVMAFMIPTGVQLAHTLDGHEHKVCKEASTHIHALEVECSIDKFQLSAFSFAFNPSELKTWELVSYTDATYYSSHYSNQYWNGIYQRGPPLTS